MVKVSTGDKQSSGTSAGVYCTLEGVTGTTGKRWLKHNGVILEDGAQQMYSFNGVDIGDVKKVLIFLS